MYKRQRHEIALAAGRLDVPVASDASLRVLISRWENGHAVPEAGDKRLLPRLFEAGELRHRLQLLSVAGDRVQEQVIGAGRHQFLEPLAHLLGRAVDA